ncbi:pyrimidine/purine nucleoside phosphorylase [Thiolinea disciformis]|uniref:pyrimidine/purine nucleoside phosphorylase n=1 Tax=Thiolinea disciformis TaxID=125614 RepID=UPI00035EB3AC|nr:pyrimidine/purine nucleoside phosphorylase [Thiolinea disciformis]
MSRLENVSLEPVANVYFDGKCVSHSFVTAEGARKSAGVILPATLTFNTAAPEIMEIKQGHCRVRLAGAQAWQDYKAGQSFSVGANSAFDIEALEPTHYICHFG